MDILYLIDNKRRVALDEYQNELLPIELDSNKDENLVSVIHYAIQQLDRIGKEKFGSNSELEAKQIFMNDETLEGVQSSSMWTKRTDKEDDTLMGDLYKIGVVHRMKTLPGSRAQIYVTVNSGLPSRNALFGLIHIL